MSPHFDGKEYTSTRKATLIVFLTAHPQKATFVTFCLCYMALGVDVVSGNIVFSLCYIAVMNADKKPGFITMQNGTNIGP